jgi:hypothetical protein
MLVSQAGPGAQKLSSPTMRARPSVSAIRRVEPRDALSDPAATQLAGLGVGVGAGVAVGAGVGVGVGLAVAAAAEGVPAIVAAEPLGVGLVLPQPVATTAKTSKVPKKRPCDRIGDPPVARA